jgi:hypothetical protein
MHPFLLWAHASAEDVRQLRRCCCGGTSGGGTSDSGASAGDGAGADTTGGGAGADTTSGGGDGLLLALAAAHAGGPAPPPPGQRAALAALYASALRAGAAWGFSDGQLSVLLGLAIETHATAARWRLPLERSYRGFVDALLRHGVERWAVRGGGWVGGRGGAICSPDDDSGR